MEVFISNKLKKFLPPNEEASTASPSEKWSAHLNYYDRRKFILFTHKETRYSFFLPGYRKSSLSDMGDLIAHNLCIQLEVDGININKAMKYLNFNPNKVYFLKTDNDQKTLGWIRDIFKNIEYYQDYHGGNAFINAMTFAHRSMNRIPIGKTGNSPIELLNAQIK